GAWRELGDYDYGEGWYFDVW
nr:immunoglobulin heavy chain junction region [Mus musculus]